MNNVKILDCTLRDGGYYNSWDFNKDLIEEYLLAMEAVGVDAVELGLRTLKNEGFQGPCAFTTDSFVNTLSIPKDLLVGVMVNASELVSYPAGVEAALSKLFVSTEESPIKLVRIACHVHEFEAALKGVQWLKDKGYIVGFNLMQIADKTDSEIENLAQLAAMEPLDVLYFADSLGGLSPINITNIVSLFRKHWTGEMGIHTHDNMSYALANSLQAVEDGVTWIDGTVTGMGRGPGNAKTEYLVVELNNIRQKSLNLSPLLKIINNYFKPLQNECGWGTNTYYYLAGKYGIHPTYIQEMLSDSKYDSEDILSVIEYLKNQEKHKYSKNTLNNARNFYSQSPKGSWKPESEIKDRKVLILGSGDGIFKYKDVLESYIEKEKPYVIALNTQNIIADEYIDVRAACHPTRLLADCQQHLTLKQPLIVPMSMLNTTIQDQLNGKEIKDFGICLKEDSFGFEDSYCYTPKILVAAYTLAIATSGKASEILLAGFDGYMGEDSRNEEMNEILKLYTTNEKSVLLYAITPTKYQIPKKSIYGMIGGL